MSRRTVHFRQCMKATEPATTAEILARNSRTAKGSSKRLRQRVDPVTGETRLVPRVATKPCTLPISNEKAMRLSHSLHQSKGLR